ncbi:DUF6745 domain-containing protein [Rhodococcus oryzae]|uniref:DUF6745 domain-containing protein n=1 Tax=Rhodococcus oryzae TaxID=2571143 RepID=UPI0037105800
MSAVPISSAVRHRTLSASVTDHHDLVAAAYARQDSWLARGLCTEPSDRSVAESAVAELYRRSGLAEPEFIWAPSPPSALKLIADTQPSVRLRYEDGAIPAFALIAELLSASRERMDMRILRRRQQPQNDRRALEATRLRSFDAARLVGVAPDLIIRAVVWESLRTSLYDGVATAIRTLLPGVVDGVTWYGQQEAHRIGYYDTIRRYGLATFDSRDNDLLDVQTALICSTGWWWAFDSVCVMAERPIALHTEPTPGGAHNARRLHHLDRPALEFSDARSVFVHHGTIVPDWVALDPTAERIGRERNVEIRRCAIERLGWDTYIDMAGLALVDRADDPGNPGCTLQLYATPAGWGRPGRILLAVNGSVERDGHRRRYGLHVPRWISSALDAAGWTYGISGADYAQLIRRT